MICSFCDENCATRWRFVKTVSPGLHQCFCVEYDNWQLGLFDEVRCSKHKHPMLWFCIRFFTILKLDLYLSVIQFINTNGARENTLLTRFSNQKVNRSLFFLNSSYLINCLHIDIIMFLTKYFHYLHHWKYHSVLFY